MKKLLQILTVLIIVVGIIMLTFSYVATIVYADEGYPAPIDNGYPIDEGYPVWGYPSPIDEGYPVYTPIDPLYPEPIASSPEIELSSITYQLEPIQPQYVNGRNLWQEIVYQFSKLLELMK